jgi:hypothetical protein
MLSALNTALRSIIDLLKLDKDVKRTDLEIDKLAREKRNAESLIQIASVDEIQEYDPRAKALKKRIQFRDHAMKSPGRPRRFVTIFMLLITLTALAVWWVISN